MFKRWTKRIVGGLLATLAIAGGLGVALSRNILYAAFSLLAAFAGMVGLFAFLSADFLADAWLKFLGRNLREKQH